MSTLSCFAMLPEGEVTLVSDDALGWVPLPANAEVKRGCEETSVDFEQVYEGIIEVAVKDAAETAGVEIESRRGLAKKPGDILKQVIEPLCRDDITITDITGLNPNVLFEYGMRAVTKDPCNILITYTGETVPDDLSSRLPFDLKGLNCFPYGIEIKSAGRARQSITDAIVEHVKERSKGKALSPDAEFKRRVDLYSGRDADRELAELVVAGDGKTLASLPKFIGPVSAALFSNALNGRAGLNKLRNDLRKLTLELGGSLGHLPELQIEFYERFAAVPGLPPWFLLDIVNKLAELHGAAGHTAEASRYVKRLEELEESLNA